MHREVRPEDNCHGFFSIIRNTLQESLRESPVLRTQATFHVRAFEGPHSLPPFAFAQDKCKDGALTPLSLNRIALTG